MRESPTDGIINLNKPHGKTSFSMVSLVRKLTGIKKVGHSGTLDPDATGVLPILIGKATRLADMVTDTTKIYRAEICFGTSTNTYDTSGETTSTQDVSSLTLDEIESKLHMFRGEISQVPPMFSAIKQEGKPLYHLARQGIEVHREPRTVTIHLFEVKDWQHPRLVAEIECSKGTYIRSLAHDLGQAIGCGAHMSQLERLKSGPFTVDHSVSVEMIEQASKNGEWEGIILSPDTALGHLHSLTVDAQAQENINHGRLFSADQEGIEYLGQLCRVYSADGRFLALASFNTAEGLWHPEKVFC